MSVAQQVYWLKLGICSNFKFHTELMEIIKNSLHKWNKAEVKK